MLAVYLSCFVDHSAKLVDGEIGTFMLLAADKRQARVLFNYVRGLLALPMLKSMVRNELKESIELVGNIKIEVHVSNFRAVRGYTLIGVIADEIAFWQSETSSNPAGEVLTALRPGLATTGGLLLAITSPYSKAGPAWEAFKDNFASDTSSTLVWRAPSRTMNPSLPKSVVDRALLLDPASAAAEFLAEFRDDLSNFLTLTEVEACVIPNRVSLPPSASRTYKGFVDMSGGKHDSATLAIGHSEAERGVLDLITEIRAPFSPQAAVKEFCGILKQYRIVEVEGDKYSAEWCSESFQKNGIRYIPSSKNRSELYAEFLPALLSRQVELVANAKMVSQFCGLVRKIGPGGKDTIDHGVGAFDDVCNAVAGAISLVVGTAHRRLGVLEWAARIKADVANGLRDVYGQLIGGPKVTPQPASRPVQTVVDNRALSEEKPSLCRRCGVLAVRSHPGMLNATLCRQCNSINQEPPQKDEPIIPGKNCCGNPLPSRVGSQGEIYRCNSCGKQTEAPKSKGMSFAQLEAFRKHRRGRFA